MTDFAKQIQSLEKEYLVLVTENKVIQKNIDEKTDENKTLDKNISLSTKSIEFIEKIIANKRNNIKAKIEELVTETLKTVYDDSYSIEFEYSIKSNKTNVEILIVKKSPALIVKRDMDGFGGGVSDTVSVPLKLLVLMAVKSADKILILDEPGKHLCEGRVENFGNFLYQLSKRMNLQIIFSSHHDVMKMFSDRAYHLTLDKVEAKTKYQKVK